MPAAVSRAAFLTRLAVRQDFLRKARKRVIFGHEAYHRTPAPETGYEGRRDACNALLDGESVLFQMAAERLGAFVLVIAHFGIVENPPLEGVVQREGAVQVFHAGRAAAHVLTCPGIG